MVTVTFICVAQNILNYIFVLEIQYTYSGCIYVLFLAKFIKLTITSY